jgi:type III secretory pathway component EscR
MRRFLGALMLSGVLMAPIAMQAKDDHRVYDRDRRDYHQWNEAENRAYRHWLTEERHHQWHDWNRASRAEQREYWRWRHEHSDWH